MPHWEIKVCNRLFLILNDIDARWGADVGELGEYL
jgi:hypothetical protein